MTDKIVRNYDPTSQFFVISNLKQALVVKACIILGIYSNHVSIFLILLFALL